MAELSNLPAERAKVNENNLRYTFSPQSSLIEFAVMQDFHYPAIRDRLLS